MARLDHHKIEVFLDGLDSLGLITVLEDVKRWPIHGSQTDTTARHFKALELIDNPDDEQARKFLRDAAVSRPHRALGWFSLEV